MDIRENDNSFARDASDSYSIHITVSSSPGILCIDLLSLSVVPLHPPGALAFVSEIPLRERLLS
jgi:hypothetical protein